MESITNEKIDLNQLSLNLNVSPSLKLFSGVRIISVERLDYDEYRMYCVSSKVLPAGELLLHEGRVLQLVDKLTNAIISANWMDGYEFGFMASYQAKQYRNLEDW